MNKIIYSPLKEEEKITALEIIFEKHDINSSKANYLCDAIQIKAEKLIDFLLDKGLDINHPEYPSKETPVWTAVKNSDYKTFEKLLQRKVDLTVLSHNESLLNYILLRPNHLEAARLLNHYKPDIITPLLSQGDVNILLQFKAVREDKYKEKIKTYKEFPSLKNQADLEMKIKHISHTFSIKGHSPIFSQKEEKNLNLEGFFSYKFFKNITRTVMTSLMTLEKQSIILSEEDEMMRNSYQVAMDSLSFTSKNPTASQLKERFDQGKWAVVYTGFKGHAVTVLLKKGDEKKNEPSRLIICNRGAASINSVQSFVFNAEDLTTENIQEMMEKMEDAEAYKKFYFGTLPSKLNLKVRKGKKFWMISVG